MKNNYSVAMVIAIISVFVAFVILTYEPKTVEQLQAEIALEQAKATSVAAQAEQDRLANEKAERDAHQRYLEREAQKTPEQKANESNISVGEAVVGTAAIGAGALLLWGMFNSVQ